MQYNSDLQRIFHDLAPILGYTHDAAEAFAITLGKNNGHHILRRRVPIHTGRVNLHKQGGQPDGPEAHQPDLT